MPPSTLTLIKHAEHVQFLIDLFGSAAVAAAELHYTNRERAKEPKFFCNRGFQDDEATNGYYDSREMAATMTLFAHLAGMEALQPTRNELHAELHALVSYEHEAFDNDQPVDGADLVEFWAERRPVLKALLAAMFVM